jgi:hypothetical protein
MSAGFRVAKFQGCKVEHRPFDHFGNIETLRVVGCFEFTAMKKKSKYLFVIGAALSALCILLILLFRETWAVTFILHR